MTALALFFAAAACAAAAGPGAGRSKQEAPETAVARKLRAAIIAEFRADASPPARELADFVAAHPEIGFAIGATGVEGDAFMHAWAVWWPELDTVVFSQQTLDVIPPDVPARRARAFVRHNGAGIIHELVHAQVSKEMPYLRNELENEILARAYEAWHLHATKGWRPDRAASRCFLRHDMTRMGFAVSVGQEREGELRRAEALPNGLLPDAILGECRRLVADGDLDEREAVFGAAYRAYELGWRTFRDLLRVEYWANYSVLEPRSNPRPGTLMGKAVGPDSPGFVADPEKLERARAYYRKRFAALPPPLRPAPGPKAEIPPAKFYAAAGSMKIKTATSSETARWLKEGSVALLDLRAPDVFLRSHLRGAANLPATDLTEEAVAKVVPSTGTRVVVYCDDNLMPTRSVALTTLGYPALRQLGYGNVYRLEDLWNTPACRSKPGESPVGCPPLLPWEGTQKP